MNDKRKLKALLKKAKDAIDGLNSKFKQSAEKVLQLTADKVSVETENVSQILAHVKVDDVGYTLV
jgi:hypothetical protein